MCDGEIDCKGASASAHGLHRMAIKGIMKWTPGYIQEREEEERQTAAVG
jgi:hypothetical protein